MAAFPQAKVETNAEFRKSQEAQINQLLVVITVLLGFSIIIAVLGISITMALGVFERTREIGLMRAVGMNKRQTRRTVRWEAIIVSTFGAVVGIVVGTLIGVALSLAVPDTVIDHLAFSPDDHRGHPDRRGPRRVRRRPVPLLQGVQHERPPGNRDRVAITGGSAPRGPPKRTACTSVTTGLLRMRAAAGDAASLNACGLAAGSVQRPCPSARNLRAAGWRSVFGSSSHCVSSRRLRRGSKRTWHPGHQ